jgi:ankyrin repeat protein
MNRARIAGLFLMVFGLAGASVAAEKAALADAAEQRKAAVFRKLLDAGADVNAAQVDGMTALHWAVYHDDAATARMLVRAGAKVNAANRYGVPPLSLAGTNGNADLVKLLLEAGADANAALPGSETILMTAARAGNLESVKALLGRGADPNARERGDQTAIMWAAAEGHAAVVRALIEGKADIRAKLKSGFTPLLFAVREGQIEAARTLLEAGVDVNEVIEPPQRSMAQQDTRLGVTLNSASFKPVRRGTSPLMMAVENGHFEMAVALIDAGADPNDERSGFTPLHAMSWVRKPDASDQGDPPPVGSGRLTSLQFVRELVKRGAKVNKQLEDAARPPNAATRLSSEEATPLLMAADRADAPFMRVLLELGADPFLANAENSTPLMAAAGLGTANPLEEAGTEVEALEAVQILLERGAGLNEVDNNGHTAMHAAAEGNFPAIVQLLADRGADANVWKRPDVEGSTPLFIAEGFRRGRPQLSRPTIEAITRLMVAKGISTEGTRPRIRDIYEKAPEPSQVPKQP